MASREQQARVKKGHLMVLPDPAVPGGDARESDIRVMAFQYNPESVTRTRKGEWSKDQTRAGAQTLQDRTLRDGHRGGGLYAKSETISFKLTFDGTADLLHADHASDRPNGVLPELAFLETVALGGDEAMKTTKRVKVPQTKPPAKAGTGKSLANPKPATAKQDAKLDSAATNKNAIKYKTKIQSTAPSELLLNLGQRTFPVVLTSLTITEERFDPSLNPTRATCDVVFRVLEAAEVKNNAAARQRFEELVKSRDTLSSVFGSTYTQDQALMPPDLDSLLSSALDTP